MRVNKSRKKKKQLNIPIIIVTIFFSVLVVGMSGYIGKYSISHRQELINNSYNKRSEILLAQNRRGSIYSHDGEVLAFSQEDEEGNEVRIYPYGPLFSHVVGYSINGKMGVEANANYYLINSNAPLSLKASLDLKEEKYPGDNVYTTLDVTLQEVASTALGVYKGAVIVTNPKTGEILCMVSKPDFDPNNIATDWERFVYDNNSSVLLNRVTQGQYPPGSTFKIITALEYIRENPNSYMNYSYNCGGSIKRGDDRIQCYHGSVHNHVDFEMSFAKSCNTSFTNMGLTFDRDAYGKTLNGLLFNQKLPVPFLSAVSSLEVDGNTSDSDMMQLSIGQGYASVSPLHLNMITSSIANHGILMKPYVIDKVVNSENNTIKEYKPEEFGRLLSEQEAQIMVGLMQGVVEKGTASRLKGLSYTAAGKTGSAEFGTVKGDSHAWFTGFAPVEDPEICVTIIIEEAGAGGDYAVPIAKRLFDAYFSE